MATKIPGAIPRPRSEPLIGGASGVMYGMDDDHPPMQDQSDPEPRKRAYYEGPAIGGSHFTSPNKIGNGF